MLANGHVSLFFGGGRGDDEDGGANIFSVIIFSMLAAFAAMLFQLAISRSREYLADEAGAETFGNPLFIASALKKYMLGLHIIDGERQSIYCPLFIVNHSLQKGLLLFSNPSQLKKG
jgi:heat shock protein HtpX